MDDGSQNQPSSQFDESDCTQEATPLPLSQNKLKLSRVRCKLISHTEKAKHFDISEDMKEIIIGRGINCTIQINEKHISKIHCRIYLIDSGYYMLEDLSTNGTYINKKCVGKNKTYILQHSDEISLSSNRVAAFTFIDLSFKLNFESAVFGEEISSSYLVLEEIGCGNSSIVRKAMNKHTGELCAIKIIKKHVFATQTKTKDQIMREVKVLKNVSHPNVIKYEKILNCDDYLYIVLELATGGDLFDKIGKMSESDAICIFKQILEAVEYLHSLGIAHRDLKPENILLSSDNKVKLTDFGLSKITDSNNMVTLCGTPSYLAPEIIKLGSKETRKGYSIAVDMWSLGVILYLILSGSPPFYDDLERRMSLYEQIETGSYNFDNIKWNDISPQAIDLIKKLLDLDPERRITAKEALKHPWITPPIENVTPPKPLISPELKKSISYDTFQRNKNKRKANVMSPFEEIYAKSKIPKNNELKILTTLE